MKIKHYFFANFFFNSFLLQIKIFCIKKTFFLFLLIKKHYIKQMSFINQFANAQTAKGNASWSGTGPFSVYRGSKAQVEKSIDEHKNDKKGLGGLLAIFFIIMAVLGILIIIWYAGSSGGSLDSSFGNHCLAATEGSSAEGGSSGTSFNSSFNSSNFNDNQAHACGARTERFQSKNCANRQLGDRSPGFGPAGAANQIQAEAAVEAARARAAGRDFYKHYDMKHHSPKHHSPKHHNVNWSKLHNKMSEGEQKMKAGLAKLKSESVSKMNDLKKASSAVQSKLEGQKNGALHMAQSANHAASADYESYIASGNMINSFLGCDKEVPDYPAQYQPQEALQQLTNSPYGLSQQGVIKTNSLIANVNGTNEAYSRRAVLNQNTSNLTTQASMNVVNAMQTQAGQSPKDQNFRDMLNKGNVGNGQGGVWNERNGAAYSTPNGASGGDALAQWGRFKNNECAKPAQMTPSPKAAQPFMLKKKQ